jgi:hypothetical protein
MTPHARLKAALAAKEKADTDLEDAVFVAHLSGFGWKEIGKIMGVAGSTAFRRYSDAVRKRALR